MMMPVESPVELDLAASDTPADVIHRSPGVTAIYNELKSSARNNILDLGSSSALSFNFFTQLSCHIHFENVDGFLEDCPEAWSSSESLRAGLDDYLSNFSEEKKFDIILVWDIFNYLDQNTMSWLVNRLNRYSHPNTLLHMVKYIGRNLPARPRHYQIIDQYQVKISCSGILCSRPFPNMDTTSMLKGMTNYVMEYTYMQHQGMSQDITEHVLRYQPDGKSNKRREASAELPGNLRGLDAIPHRSYGLEHICKYLLSIQNATVLDLGSKVTRTSDFFHLYAENVYVEDIIPSLTENDSAIRKHALRYPEHIKFDVVIAWDLFSYCNRTQLAAIFQKLQPHLHEKTKIFAFFYTSSELPVRPQKCYILDDKSIALIPAPKRPSSSTELSAVGLLKIFNQFNLENTYILQPGMLRGIYEYIFQAKLPNKQEQSNGN